VSPLLQPLIIEGLTGVGGQRQKFHGKASPRPHLKADWVEVELFLGHRKFDGVSDIYAPFDPSYYGVARQEIE
jgi:hypothetical protein